jgi:hypothetical protein
MMEKSPNYTKYPLEDYMFKKYIYLLLLMFLPVAAYSYQAKNTVDLELKIPEAIIVNSSDFIHKIEELKLQKSAGSDEELVQDIFESREVIEKHYFLLI